MWQYVTFLKTSSTRAATDIIARVDDWYADLNQAKVEYENNVSKGRRQKKNKIKDNTVLGGTYHKG